jgi:F-type H+-transporting ATPase subunit c
MDPIIEAATLNADAIKSIAKAIAIGVGVFGPGIGIGMLVSKALEGIARNPGASKQIMTPMFIGIAAVEALAIFALLIAFTI